jgi:hypothetical protein
MTLRFCVHCGAPLRAVILDGDDHERLQCTACARIHYVNPEVQVGCIVCAPGAHEPALLLARPGRGEKIQSAVLRALAPAGVEAGALREEDLALFATLTDVGSARLFLVFRVPGECLEARVRPPLTVPWGAELLDRFAADRAARRFGVYTGHFDGAHLALRAVPADRGAWE